MGFLWFGAKRLDDKNRAQYEKAIADILSSVVNDRINLRSVLEQELQDMHAAYLSNKQPLEVLLNELSGYKEMINTLKEKRQRDYSNSKRIGVFDLYKSYQNGLDTLSKTASEAINLVEALIEMSSYNKLLEAQRRIQLLKDLADKTKDITATSIENILKLQESKLQQMAN